MHVDVAVCRNLAFKYIQRLLESKNYPSDLWCEFQIVIVEPQIWNLTDYICRIKFRDDQISFVLDVEKDNWDIEFQDHLKTAVLNLLNKIPHNNNTHSDRLLSQKRKKHIINSRFRPNLHLKPTWEQ